MRLFKRWRKRRYDELPVSDLRFVGEQDGEPERRLKSRLVDLFSRQRDIECAYLARAVNRGESTVMLCVATRSDEPDTSLVREISTIFAAIFSKEHLDILFVSDMQETELKVVCAPFCSWVASQPSAGFR